MKVDELLAMMDAVRPTRRGWRARCPAHQDRTPSLYIREGERGILMKCFACCTLHEICAALNIRVANLFFNDGASPDTWHREKQIRATNRRRAQAIQHLIGLTIDRAREALRLIETARDIDISHWTETELDERLDLLADAYETVEEERRVYGDPPF